MTNLSPMWVKKVTPIDDDFIPYVGSNQYQYKPGLVPTYVQPQPYTYDAPITTRGVTLGVAASQAESQKKTAGTSNKNKLNNRRNNAQTRHADIPMGPDIPFKDYQYSKSASMPMGPDIRYRDYGIGSYGIKGSVSKTKKPLPMGPDIRYRDYAYKSYGNQKTKSGRVMNGKTRGSPLPMGPDIRYRETKYVAPSDRYNVSSSLPMGPDIPFRDYRNTSKSNSNKRPKRTIKPIKPTKKATKDKRNVQIREEDAVVYKGQDYGNGVTAAGVAATAAVAQTNDDWKRPYELAGEAAVLSWIRMQEESKRRGNRYHGHAFSRYEIEENPTGARASLRRTYDFHGADF